MLVFCCFYFLFFIFIIPSFSNLSTVGKMLLMFLSISLANSVKFFGLFSLILLIMSTSTLSNKNSSLNNDYLAIDKLKTFTDDIALYDVLKIIKE